MRVLNSLTKVTVKVRTNSIAEKLSSKKMPKLFFLLLISLLFINLIIFIILSVSGCTISKAKKPEVLITETTKAIISKDISKDNEKKHLDNFASESSTIDTITNNYESYESSNLENENSSEFSVKINSNSISLLAWDNVNDFYSFLGQPLSEKIEKLSQSADTFAGSFKKTVKYEGLEIVLFSPKDNGKSFWVMEILVLKNGIITNRGIQIGDSVKLLKEKYPSISKVKDGRTDDNNCSYEIADRERYCYLRFEVNKGIVSQIRLFHELP